MTKDTKQQSIAEEHLAQVTSELLTRAETAEERLRFCEARLTAITKWLEANQPDVFRRGLWDAVNKADPYQYASHLASMNID